MKPKVSILLLTFNTLTKVGEKFTKFMIESIFRQDHPNLTHIVIDNHSQDNTLAYLEKLISDHASTEFHIIKLAKNYGYTGGNNRGAMYAHLHEVEYLFFMNDDIILLDKSLITTLIENLEKNKDIGAVQPLIINKGGSLNCGFQFGFHLYLK